MTKVNRKKSAVRMLGQAIHLTTGITGSRMSVGATGRLQKEMHKYLAVLKRLELDDPDEQQFWVTLQKAILTIVKCLRQIHR